MFFQALDGNERTVGVRMGTHKYPHTYIEIGMDEELSDYTKRAQAGTTRIASQMDTILARCYGTACP